MQIHSASSIKRTVKLDHTGLFSHVTVRPKISLNTKSWLWLLKATQWNLINDILSCLLCLSAAVYLQIYPDHPLRQGLWHLPVVRPSWHQTFSEHRGTWNEEREVVVCKHRWGCFNPLRWHTNSSQDSECRNTRRTPHVCPHSAVFQTKVS